MTDSKIHCADHDYFDGLCGACYRELRKFAKQADQRIAEQQRVIDQLQREKAELQRLCERAYLVIDESYEKLSDGEFGPSSLLKDLGKAKDGKELRDVNLLNEVLAKANKHLQAEHTTLVERVKAHNAEMLAMCENNPKCNKKNGYPNVRCLNCPKENLIDLDTAEGGK